MKTPITNHLAKKLAKQKMPNAGKIRLWILEKVIKHKFLLKIKLNKIKKDQEKIDPLDLVW